MGILIIEAQSGDGRFEQLGWDDFQIYTRDALTGSRKTWPHLYDIGWEHE
jgi:hypothetical protein